MESNLPAIAGATSTLLFIIATLPMLGKALRTRDLASYSLSHILLMNVGNVVHAVYISSLPAGPIWALYTFQLVTTGLMLLWYLRYEWLPSRHARSTGPAVPAGTITRRRVLL